MKIRMKIRKRALLDTRSGKTKLEDFVNTLALGTKTKTKALNKL
jgi:hypothetical protein